MATVDIYDIKTDNTDSSRFIGTFKFRVDEGFTIGEVYMYDMDGSVYEFESIADYALSDDIVPGETDADRIDRSLVENGGIIFVPQNPAGTELKVIMATQCIDSNNNKIGFHSGKLKFTFVLNSEQCFCEYNVVLFPRITHGIIYQAELGDDPVLSASGIRYGYDFGIDGNDTTDRFYANTCNTQGCVPTYALKLSAYSNLSETDYMYDWDNASSYMLNTGTGKRYPIDYSKVNAGTVSIEPVPGYTADMGCYEITQVLSGRYNEYYANAVKFDVDLKPRII